MAGPATAAKHADLGGVAPSEPVAAKVSWLPTPGDATVAKALLVDPDREIWSAPALHMLRQNGVAIEQAPTRDAAMAALSRRSYSLLILELAADEYDGSDLCRWIVEQRGPPVLVWSRRAAPLDQVAGLELGAEDYLAKSAHPLELLARVRSILRRGRMAATPPQDPAAGLAPSAWLFDPRVNSLRSWRGSRVWLRPASSALLKGFCERPRQSIAREELLAEVSRGEAPIASRTVDVVVSRLRRSLEACDGGGYLVRTVRPKGYLFDAAVEPDEAGLVIRG